MSLVKTSMHSFCRKDSVCVAIVVCSFYVTTTHLFLQFKFFDSFPFCLQVTLQLQVSEKEKEHQVLTV